MKETNNKKDNKGSKKKTILTIFGIIAGILVLGAIGIVVVVKTYVFPKYDGLETTGKYKVTMSKAILVDDSRVEQFETDGSKREVPVYIYYPENAEAGETFPLVFFSHGAFGYYQSNYSTYAELASNGYVVVSVDHPYHAFFTKDTDGNTIIVNQQFMKDISDLNNIETYTAEMEYEITRDWMELRLADMNFVIDSVKVAAENNTTNDSWYIEDDMSAGISKALSMIDYTKIGAMGHSLGGATAVTIGRMRDDILAVIDIDGTMLGEECGYEDGNILVNHESYTVPILSFDNEESRQESIEIKESGIDYVNNVVLENAVDSYSTYVAGSGHMNYTDLPMFSPALANMLGTGSVDAEYCMNTVNHIILEFFDCYLKGEGQFSVQEGY